MTPLPISVPPLAERMRPRSLDQVFGQPGLVGPGGALPPLLTGGRPPSLVLWGPPGCGKTTIARIISREIGLEPVAISAVTSGVREIKSIVEEARASLEADGPPTLLFVDEVHRFNKAQQDAFLGPLEDGTLILIGATTENPSFELIAPLLSRCRVLTLKSLDDDSLATILDLAISDEDRGLGGELRFDEGARRSLIAHADGDARVLLSDLEWIALGAADRGVTAVDTPLTGELLSWRGARHDRAGDQHYDTISALHKSLRGSDVQASLYWLARMLEGGDDPLYVARRLVRFATEDIGSADPHALSLTIAARDAVHFLGMPEGALALAEAVVHLASAPKSDALYRAYSEAADAVRRHGSLPVPKEVRNAPTQLMKEMGHGAGYINPHRDRRGLSVPFLPEELRGSTFYRPGKIGFEREIEKRMRWWQDLRERAREDLKSS